ERAGAVREKEALVWIERERVSAREAFEERAELRAGVEEGAVSAVDVVPESLARGEIGDGVEGVDGAGVRRARARRDEGRPEPGAPVRRDGVGEGVDTQAEVVVDGDRAYAVVGDPRQPRRFSHRVMRLGRRIEDALA